MEHRILVLDQDMSTSSHNFAPLPWSWIQSTTPQVNLYQALEILPDLGLKLSKTPSFLDKLDQLAQLQNSREQSSSNFDYFTAKEKSKDVLQHTNKMKAENFPISLLKIGSWQRVSINEGDLVAKCYFAKRKLVWEFLENGLKSKIEIQWSDILSLKVVMQENQPGILEIELHQPPSFHHEIDPQPRKHTQWRIVSDFTGGEALTHRRHYLKFPPGVLDKPLEKLLKYDNRLFQLIQRGFPTLKSPYFQKYTFGPGYVCSQQQQQQQQFSFPNVPTSTYKQTTQNSFNIKDSDSPVSEHVHNQTPLWSEGMNNVRDSLITNQVGGMPFATSSGSQLMNSTISFRNNHNQMSGYVEEGIQLNSTISFQNNHNHVSGFVQQGMENNQLGGLLSTTPSTSHVHPTLSSFQIRNNDLQSMLLNNWPTDDFPNGIVEGNLFSEGHSISNMTTNYEQTMNMVDNIVVMSNNLSSTDGRLIHPQVAISRSQSQVPHDNTSINMLYGQSQSQVLHENMNMNMLHQDDNLFYSSANSDPTMQYLSNFNHEANDDWYCN